MKGAAGLKRIDTEGAGVAPEYKFYAAGVGQVLTLEGDVRVELVSKTSN